MVSCSTLKWKVTEMFGRSSHEEHPHDSEGAGAFEVFTPFLARFLINPNALLSKQPLSLHHLKTAAKTHAQAEGAGYHLYW